MRLDKRMWNMLIDVVPTTGLTQLFIGHRVVTCGTLPRLFHELCEAVLNQHRGNCAA